MNRRDFLKVLGVGVAGTIIPVSTTAVQPEAADGHEERFSATIRITTDKGVIYSEVPCVVERNSWGIKYEPEEAISQIRIEGAKEFVLKRVEVEAPQWVRELDERRWIEMPQGSLPLSVGRGDVVTLDFPGAIISIMT
jgi:hypothetical protein